jgi:hypothetical protein
LSRICYVLNIKEATPDFLDQALVEALVRMGWQWPTIRDFFERPDVHVRPERLLERYEQAVGWGTPPQLAAPPSNHWWRFLAALKEMVQSVHPGLVTFLVHSRSMGQKLLSERPETASLYIRPHPLIPFAMQFYALRDQTQPTRPGILADLRVASGGGEPWLRKLTLYDTAHYTVRCDLGWLARRGLWMPQKKALTLPLHWQRLVARWRAPRRPRTSLGADATRTP